jgi:hypothetical protein
MNSDPHESAAWRAFGMLDADAAAGFDEAMRRDPELKSAYREMECLTAAVAAATTRPVTPRAGQLERLHLRLGLNVSNHTNWLGISGWAAAAVLTAVLLFQRGPAHRELIAKTTVISPTTSHQIETPPPQPREETTAAAGAGAGAGAGAENGLTNAGSPDQTAPRSLAQSGEVKTIVKVETKRLIQEIQVLREKLEDFQERDRQRFEPVAGMAWPIVMRMTRPKDAISPTSALVQEQEDPTITAMLGDAMTAANRAATPNDTAMAEPSAIPIYDPARQTGTLYVTNLEPAQDNEDYYLWAETKKGGKPNLVGKLPKSNTHGPESFDFNMASDSAIPSIFTLTKDHGTPATPSASNTVLRGPH